MISRSTSERWNVFKQQKDESILSYKEEIQIIIYGAYNPPDKGKQLGGKTRLIKLRDYLRNDGYSNTHIVADFPDDDKSISSTLDKSLACLEFADLNILIFTCRGKTDSVTRELIYAIENNLLSRCMVIEEVHKDIPAMGILLKEELRKFSFTVEKVEYENEAELRQLVLGFLFSFLEIYAKKSKIK